MAQDTQDSRSKADSAPDPESSRKPDSLGEIEKPAWSYVLKRAVSEFSKDDCTDLAATLTYFAVLALFPALLAMVSLLGVFGQGQATTQAIINFLQQYAPQALVELLRQPISNLASGTGAGLALITGLLGALWTASGYTGAFGRAMNRIYEIEEGRPIWKLRPMNILVTLLMVVIVAVIMLMVIVSGGIAQWVGNLIGLGSTAVTVWSIAKWPVIALLLILLIAVLYYFTPNVKQPKFRWMSVGALVAIIVAILASVAFAFYVANFGSYNATYGALASVIIFLLWLWIINVALLFGAEFDAEMERGRELQAGQEAEESIQLPLRDTKASDKKAEKAREDIAKGRELRRTHGKSADADDNG